MTHYEQATPLCSFLNKHKIGTTKWKKYEKVGCDQPCLEKLNKNTRTSIRREGTRPDTIQVLIECKQQCTEHGT